MEAGGDVSPVPKDQKNDFIPLDRIDSPPRGNPQGPHVLISRQLVDVEVGRSVPWVLCQLLKGPVEPELLGTRQSREALSRDAPGEP